MEQTGTVMKRLAAVAIRVFLSEKKHCSQKMSSSGEWERTSAEGGWTVLTCRRFGIWESIQEIASPWLFQHLILCVDQTPKRSLKLLVLFPFPLVASAKLPCFEQRGRH